MLDLPAFAEEPKTPFLVTGLPRSRTAWFAVACDCAHEPTAGDAHRAIDLWRNGVTGISDSGLSRHLGLILSEVSLRTLVVRRPRQDVLQSLKRYFGDAFPVDWADMERRLVEAEAAIDAAQDHPAVRLLAYADLVDIEIVADAIGWLTGDPCGLRHAQLMHMNIQSDLSYNIALARTL